MKKIAIFLIFLLLGINIALVAAFAENIAVIVNSESPAPATLEIKDVKNIYLGNSRFWGNSIIKPINQNNKEIITRFLEKVCGLDVNAYQYYWLNFEFDTGLTAPRVMNTAQEVAAYVQQEKAAIGYLWESQAKGIEGVKVILLITD